MSFIDDIPLGAPDSILGIAEAYRDCNDPKKVNVCVGAYRDTKGKPWVLPSVSEAEKLLIEIASNNNKEYLPIEGDGEFLACALEFMYGEGADLSHIAGVQSLGGTGACRLGGEFFSRFLPNGTHIYIPDVTWGNHLAIFKSCGLDVQRYRYFDASANGLNFDGMLEDISKAPEGSIILLHACAHNPTGIDPSNEQWSTISSLIVKKGHHAFFDSAYQGFASGDAAKDAHAVRYFLSQGHNVALAQSFSKNFGLYGERCGTFSICCQSPDQKDAVLSQLKLIIRPMYSNPPKHGSSIVKTVLKQPTLREQHEREMKAMATRIHSMRALLKLKLEQIGSSHNWDHIVNQIGMFAYTGMNSKMCEQLTADFSIFLPKNGRISLASLNDDNIDYVANAIHTVTIGKSITQ